MRCHECLSGGEFMATCSDMNGLRHVRQSLEILPLDAPYGMDLVRLHCRCTKRGRVYRICDRCKTPSPIIGALLVSRLREMLEIGSYTGSHCAYTSFLVGQIRV